MGNELNNEILVTEGTEQMELPKDIWEWICELKEYELRVILGTVLSDRMKHSGVKGIKNYVELIKQNLKVK